LKQAHLAAYVYPGWHPCPERDRWFPPGWSEWDLVLHGRPCFPGHEQPRLPLDGPYDDSRPETAARQVAQASQYGIDLFVYGLFWSRGKRVFERALDSGFLGCAGLDFPFALMWANRMPRRVLPVKRAGGSLIHPHRLVYTDPEDFQNLLRFAAERYFSRSHYFRIEGRPLFAIFDSTFFVRQMGPESARETILAAREHLREVAGLEIHLLALNPAPWLMGSVGEIGFDSAAHYVQLPEWKGDYLQDYQTLTRRRMEEWPQLRRQAGVPYFPSVAPGWDATPRGALHGGRPARRYPWWPIVTGTAPHLFSDFLASAIRFSSRENPAPLVFAASWNEWSEGHYLEPDRRHGTGWLEAVRDARTLA